MLLEAAEQFEHYRELTMDNKIWLVSATPPSNTSTRRESYESQLMESDACVNLAGVYRKLAEQAAVIDLDFDTSYQYYIKVYNNARQGLELTFSWCDRVTSLKIICEDHR